MFARAGISSRAFRGEHTGGFFGRPKKKKKDEEKRKFRCYVPFMWPACAAVCCGLLVLCGGTAMCVTGYYARNFTTIELSNGTNTWYEIDRIRYALMWNMTYVGPILMGFGCFAIVIACVVVCETRDRMLKIIEQNEKLGKKTHTKPDFYDLVIKRLRHDPNANARAARAAPPDGKQVESPPPRRKSIFNVLLRRSSLKSIKSTKSEFAHIGSALRRIPMQIFAIEIEQRKKSSLLPITLTLGVDIGRKRIPVPDRSAAVAGTDDDVDVDDDNNLFLVPKYPSASCIGDLLRLTDDKLSSLFPDMNTWLAEVQPRSKKWQRMTRNSLVPFPPTTTCQSHSESRDADESDTDSLCSVTVHVQAEKDKRKCHLAAIPRANDDGGKSFGIAPPSLSRSPPPARWRSTNEDQNGLLAVPGRDQLNPNIAHRSPPDDRIPAVGKPSSRHRRRSLLRQQRVVEDIPSPPETSRDGGTITHQSPNVSRANIVCDTKDNSDQVGSASVGEQVTPSDGDPKIARPMMSSSGYLDTVGPEVHRTDRRYPERCCSGPFDVDNDLLKAFDNTKTGRRKLFCSEDTDDCGSLDHSPETRKLLSYHSDDGDSSSAPGSRGSRDHLADEERLRKQDIRSLFTPYNPAESNARLNSDMRVPAAKAWTPPRRVDASPAGKPGRRDAALGQRSMTSQLRYESERLPADASRVRKSKTVSGYPKVVNP
ncbi:hypothetical protein LSH36_657g00002 [Paralvinella palmiformis]|uniref:Uncharacterized protein n=1 Tax=Paralvinella palmiformis TaxID=53620 RepID=A0AAD9J452_9ANNE|nr:hypothetical protein LSH36_657g00002 [Paralvinella palmiformis]